MADELLSIVMVVYNHAAYITEAIESVLAQTYTNWELIIVDDGSRDDSFQKANLFAGTYPQRIRLFTHQGRQNRGISASYELGLEQVKGGFVGFLEPDDIWLKENARRKIEVLNSHKTDFVYSNVRAIGDSATISLREPTLKLIRSIPGNRLFNPVPGILVIDFIPSFSAVIVKKNILKDIRFIRSRRLEIGLDWFFWIQMGLRSSFYFLTEELVCWRLHSASSYNSFLKRDRKTSFIMFGLQYKLLVFKQIIMAQRCGLISKTILICHFIWSAFRRAVMGMRADRHHALITVKP